MRHLMFAFILPLILFVGCDGDGGGGDDAAVDGAAVDGGADVAAADTDGVYGDGVEVVRFWVHLAETGGTVPPGTHFIGGANAPGPGIIRANIRWDAPPENLTLWLAEMHDGTESEQVYGPSPLSVQMHVDGGTWTDYIRNDFPMPVYVWVEFMFLPD